MGWAGLPSLKFRVGLQIIFRSPNHILFASVG